MESCLKLIQRKSYNKFGVICLYTQSAYNLPLYTIWCNLPLHNLLIINFGIVLLLSIIYAYSVKHRVEIFANPLSLTPFDAKDQSQPLSAISQAATYPYDTIDIVCSTSLKFVEFSGPISLSVTKGHHKYFLHKLHTK